MNNFFAPLVYFFRRVWRGMLIDARRLARRKKHTTRIDTDCLHKLGASLAGLHDPRLLSAIQHERERANDILYYLAGHPNAANDPAYHDEYARLGAIARWEDETIGRFGGGIADLIRPTDPNTLEMWEPGIFIHVDGTDNIQTRTTLEILDSVCIPEEYWD